MPFGRSGCSRLSFFLGRTVSKENKPSRWLKEEHHLKPIYIDQGNGLYKKYEGSIEALQTLGWPSFAPAGSLPKGVSTASAAYDHVYSRQSLPADLMTFKQPSEKDWANFALFLKMQSLV